MPFHISPYAALLVFVAVSVLVGGVMAGAGGWRALAERYPAPVTPPLDEERYRFTSIRTGWGLFGTALYQGCVTVGVSSRGLSLVRWTPFRLFHPPRFIPREALESCRSIEWHRGGQWTQITVRDGGDLTVTGQAAAAIFRYAADRGLPQGTAQQPAQATDRPDGRRRGPARGGTLRERAVERRLVRARP